MNSKVKIAALFLCAMLLSGECLELMAGNQRNRRNRNRGRNQNRMTPQRAQQMLQQRMQAMAKQMFARLDRNQDKSLSVEEFTVGTNSPQGQRVFLMMDTNKDEKLSFAEYSKQFQVGNRQGRKGGTGKRSSQPQRKQPAPDKKKKPAAS